MPADPDLRAAVEELLHFDAKAESEPDFLHSPAADSPRRTAADDWRMPASFGRYRILRLHGEGGMGTVYEAEQDNPRRTVALKVIRPGLVSAELLNRFSHEAQILGRLQHPGIAQVYEAGRGDDGQPFFAMEFICGMPLDEYSRSRGLDAAARLELLARVCDAVQHAHDKGVIHRDLKPGNILVDESGQPKVLDFGVAHVTDADLLTTSSRTQTGQLLGTLSYMSPEQLAARPSGLDGRSDVYTLGVILFELLAHRLPYHLDQLPVHEVARVIEQQEPSRLGSIDTLYRGDVEIIVAKALEKDKTRRYASAGDLASDIRRYLRGKRFWPGLPRHSISSASLLGGTSGWWPGCQASSRRSSWEPSFRSCLPCVPTRTHAWQTNSPRCDENARIANEREHAATYQSYRARIAAAVAALAQHDIVDAARQLDAAPEPLRDWEWRHLHNRLDDSTSVFPASAGEYQCLVHDPKGIQIAQLTFTSLRLTDLEGSELLTRSFRPEAKLMHRPPLPTRRGLRMVGRDVENVAGNRVTAEFPERFTNLLKLLDDEGRVQTVLKGPDRNGSRPDGHQSGPGAAGSDLDGDQGGLGVDAVRPGFGQTGGEICPGYRLHLGPCLQSRRNAHRHRRRRWGDTPVGHIHRRADCPMSRAHAQGPERRVPPGWSAPRDGLVGWDRPPMGFHDGPGDSVALRSSHGGSHDGGIQP